MTPDTQRWERRFDGLLMGLAWVTLGIGVFVTFFQAQPSPDSGVIAAAAGATIYVLGLQVIPRRLFRERRRLTAEAVALIGSALCMAAVGLTGGPNSDYLLLSLTPVLFGAFFGGFRIGLATAAFSGALLFAQSVGLGENFADEFPEMIRWGFLYLLVAITFAQARRLLVEEQQRAFAFAAASEEAQLRLARLESANQLLNRLSEIADSSELNPIEVGDAALDGLARILPMKAGLAALASDSGPVVVARRGLEGPADVKTSIPLAVGNRDVGLILVTTDEPLTPLQRGLAEDSVRPVALAFSNVQLLQEIARRAIREERHRLARELHDEIGPSLASLGLAVDLAMLQNPTEPAMAGHLQGLRESVGGLVDEIRNTVADLREEEHPSITESIQRTLRKYGDVDAEIVIELDEQRPPRPSIAADITAIVTESLRNAIRHSGASTITVKGASDFDHGTVIVSDDGDGFSPAKVPDGHFGLIGMEERAHKIEAALDVTTGPSGTTVTISWGTK
jgi:signal transduction histidine kinase